MKKAKDGHRCSRLRVQGCSRPPSDFKKLLVVSRGPNTSAKIHCEGVNAILFEDNEIFMVSLPERADFTLDVS